MPNDKDKPSIIKKLSDSEDLIDLMIDVEDYLDSNNIYAFANWIHGELVAGPYVKKYWVNVTFKWPHEKMPDPRAARRLLAQGTRIEFEKSSEAQSVEVRSPSDYQPGTKRPKIRKVPVWLVKMSIPRRFVSNVDDEVLDLYDEEIDGDTLETAKPDELDAAPQQGQDNQVAPSEIGGPEELKI
jgi:hypothetical protein